MVGSEGAAGSGGTLPGGSDDYPVVGDDRPGDGGAGQPGQPGRFVGPRGLDRRDAAEPRHLVTLSFVATPQQLDLFLPALQSLQRSLGKLSGGEYCSLSCQSYAPDEDDDEVSIAPPVGQILVAGYDHAAETDVTFFLLADGTVGWKPLHTEVPSEEDRYLVAGEGP